MARGQRVSRVGPSVGKIALPHPTSIDTPHYLEARQARRRIAHSPPSRFGRFRISTPDSRVSVWVIPTNEELITTSTSWR